LLLACVALRVGDGNEDALACQLVTSTLLRREPAAVFVVRDKRNRTGDPRGNQNLRSAGLHTVHDPAYPRA